MNNFFIKLDRLAARVLMVVIILYAVSGYGMTKGLINPDFARSLHFSGLAGIGIVAFIIHTYWALHLTLRRRQIWNKYSRAALLAFYVLLAGFFLYVHFFYSSSAAATAAIYSDNNSVPTSETAPVGGNKTDINLKIFSAATLAAYNGLNGQPAYAAVSGIVYDLSPVFINGWHQGHRAGQDLTAVFYSQHVSSLLKRYPVVGTYQP